MAWLLAILLPAEQCHDQTVSCVPGPGLDPGQGNPCPSGVKEDDLGGLVLGCVDRH